MLRIFYMLSILLVMPVSAMAADINDKGAETLKKSFQDFLDYYKFSNEILGNTSVIYDGEINVAQETEYYTLTLPSISFKTPEVEDKTQNYVFNIGVITINAIPDDKAGYWKTVLNFPDNMMISNGIKEENIIFSFKNQNTVALLNEKLGYFTKFNMNLSDITVKNDKDNLDLNIGGVQIYSKLDEDDSGKFSGPGHVTISNLALNDTKSNEDIKLGELKIDFNMSGLALPALGVYQEKILKHKETLESLSKLDEENASAENINGDNVVDMIIDMYDFEMEGFDFKYSVKDLDISEYSEDDSRGSESFKIDTAFMSLGLDGLNADKGTIHIKSGYNGLDIDQLSPEYEDIFPKNMGYSIKAENIPYSDLSNLVISSTKSIASNPDMATMVGMGILMRLPAILSQADTKIIFDNNGVSNDIYDININGKIITDLAAMMSFSMDFKTIFKGLDELLVATKKLTEKDKENTVEIMDFTKILVKLQEIGKNETGTDGKSSYIFDIKSTVDGKFMVNDIDVSTISY